MSQGTRINKYLSEAGICSRREADRLVAAGLIKLNGEPVPMGYQVMPGDTIYYKNKAVRKEEPIILLAYHKPRGVVCTTSRADKDNIIDAIHYDRRVYPIGRLDKDSEGLILLTNQGQLMDNLLRGRNRHEKEYYVWVDRPISDEVLEHMRNGVPILDTVTRPCQITRISDKSFRIILTQGLNRQIRRMCEYYHYKVIRLKRVRIMSIELATLRMGTFRLIEGEEYNNLMKELGLSHIQEEQSW